MNAMMKQKGINMGAQEDYMSLSELADRLFGDDGDADKRERWLSDHMRQLGHKATSIWQDADDGDSGDSGGSGYFGGREKRRISGNSRNSEKKKDWMYG